MRRRILTWVIIASIGAISLVSCNKDNKEDFVFSSESLRQTTWEGTEVVIDGGKVIRTIDVTMQFYTTDNGQYILKEEGSETEVYNFKYSIEGKIMDIKDGPLFSKRTILEASKDKLVLEAFSSFKSTLTLNRLY